MPKSLHSSRLLALALCLAVEAGAPAYCTAERRAQPGGVSTIDAPVAGVAQDPNDAAGAGGPKPENGAGAGDPNVAAPVPPQASSPATRGKAPRKEERD